MKKKFLFIVFLFLFTCLAPLFIAGNKNTSKKLHIKFPKHELIEKNQNNESFFKILDTSSNKIIKISDKDFECGAVAYEMPATFHKEAIKAQIVASYTYFSRLRENAIENPQKDLNGAHFKANLKEGEFFLTNEKLHERWKDNFDKNFSYIKKCVDEVLGEKIFYNDKLIFAAYHAISSGTTEFCYDVFQEDLSYLRAVPSPGDLFANGYKTVVEFTIEDFKQKLLALENNLSFEGPQNTWVNNIIRTTSGKIKSLDICKKSFSGEKIREIFSLRSANFCLEILEDKIKFTVLGHGHGVGMSQYGAEFMAKQGANYKDILNWYYPGTQIRQ